MRRSLATTFGSPWLRRVVLGLAVAAALLLILLGPQPCDDAYVTFRHAKNLALELRPAWNLEGPPVLGSASPAMIALLALPASLLGVDRIPMIALYFNALLLSAIVVLCYLVALDLTGRWLPALSIAALVGFNSVNLYVFSLGFENALLLAVLLGGLFAARRGLPTLALVLASVAPLVQPAGILLSPLVWAHILQTGAFRPRLLAAWAGLPLLWLAFATSYYGSPVPQPMRAQQAFPASHADTRVDPATRLAELPRQTASLWRSEAEPLLFSGSLQKAPPSLRHRWTRWIALISLPWLAWSLVRRRDARLIYLLYPPLFLVLHAWIGHTPIWSWPSFVTLSILLLFSSCTFSLEWMARRSGASRWRAGEIATLALFLLFAGSSAYGLVAPASDVVRSGPIWARAPGGDDWQQTEASRLVRYRRAAAFLNDRTTGRESALTREIGVFGFYYDGPVIDAAGLFSPESVMALEPDYVVDSQILSANLLREGSPFLEAYVKLQELPEIRGAALVIFERASPQPRQALPLVAHAGGGWPLGAGGGEVLDYSNSREALDRAYAEGHRLFELDFQWTTDRELVALHDWHDRFARLFVEAVGPRDRAEFLRLESRYGLQQLDLRDVLHWLESHPGSRIVTDIKNHNLSGLALIRRLAGRAQQRFIPQIYRTKQWRPARELGYRDIILTLYRTEIGDDALVAFARDHPLFAVTMPTTRARSTLPARLDALDVFVYVHTINDPAELDDLRERWSVGGVYTDAIAPRAAGP